MGDILINAIETFGNQALVWVLTLLGGLFATFVISKVKNGWAQDALNRAWAEITDAVLEVEQVYVSEIRKAKEDGKLTDEEKAHALSMAVQTAKNNIGAKGIKRLLRVLGLKEDSLNSWLETKVESKINQLKKMDVVANPTRAR